MQAFATSATTKTLVNNYRPAVVAHRANGFGFPENTVPGFAAAVQAGIDGIETDIRLTADGIPVIHHDSRVKSTGQEIHQTTTADLPHWLPTLADIVATIPPSLLLDVEIKPGIKPVAPVLDVLQGFQSWRASSFDWTVLRAVRSINPDVEIGMLVPDDAVHSDLVAASLELNATGLHLSVAQIQAGMASVASSLNLQVRVYTANDVDQWELSRQAGAQTIMTDKPLELREWLSSNR